MNLDEISNIVSNENKKNQNNAYLLNPFNLFYERNDMHVMLFFTGHQKYESIEAMICEKDSLDIRVIITRHDQTQIDYMNNIKKVEKLKSSGTNRETYYTQIEYKKIDDNLKPEVSLRFCTIDNEQVDFKLVCVGKPSKKHAGLTNPEGHSVTTSIPVMYRDLSTLASNKSRIEINGLNYSIPVLIHVPVFFTGMKGYYSENYKMGIIRAGELNSEIIQYPNGFTVGEKWVYKMSDEVREYTISKIDNDLVTITSVNEKITGILVGDKLGILNIGVSAINNNSSMLISFEKPLFNNLNYDAETGFSISIDENKNLIMGSVKFQKKTSGQEYQLIPSVPAWAQCRKMDIVINENQKNINWKCKIELNEK